MKDSDIIATLTTIENAHMTVCGYKAANPHRVSTEEIALDWNKVDFTELCTDKRIQVSIQNLMREATGIQYVEIGIGGDPCPRCHGTGRV